MGLYLVAKLTDFHLERKALLLTGAGGCIATILQAASLPTIGVMAVDVLVITAVAGYYQRKKVNLCLFLAFFYEIGVGLWDFLLQAGLGILFRSENFIDPKAPENLAGIWLVRLVMLGVAVFLAKQPKESTTPMRLTLCCGNAGAVWRSHTFPADHIAIE